MCKKIQVKKIKGKKVLNIKSCPGSMPGDGNTMHYWMIIEEGNTQNEISKYKV